LLGDDRDPGSRILPEIVHRFDYDQKAPLDIREVGAEIRDGVTIRDISYASPKGGRVPA
jgi:hypothetical protein